MSVRRLLLATLLASVAACGPATTGGDKDAGTDADAGMTADAGLDAGEADAGTDAGEPPLDGGPVTHQVTASGDSWETITPSGAQTVADGATQAFTVTANEHYVLSQTVGGTCPAGSWADSVYTTGAITADCSVTFSATLETFQVTPSVDDWANVTPDSPQTVSYGAAQAFTVTPEAGYSVSATVGGTCPAGSWAGGVYTTGAVVADCSVAFTTFLTPTALVFGQQPTTMTAGNCITPAPTVVLKDYFGNTLATESTDMVEATLTAGPVTITRSAALVDGVATFNGSFCLSRAGTGYTVQATFAAYDLSVTSDPFDVLPGDPAEVKFSTQPTTVVVGHTMAPVVVTIIDEHENTTPSATGNITISLVSENPDAHVTGTLTKPAVNGVATFDDLVIDAAGTYQLSAEADTNASTQLGYPSNTFVVRPTRTVTVQGVGLGAGSISGLDSTCAVARSDCQATVGEGDSVTLTAQADPGYLFVGWRGEGCSGTGTCTVTASSDVTVKAGFVGAPFYSWRGYSAVFSAPINGAGPATPLVAPGNAYASPDYMFSVSRDGMTFAYVSRADPSGAASNGTSESVWVADLWAGETRAVAPLLASSWPQSITVGSMSADGKHIAFFANDSARNVYTVDADGSHLVNVTQLDTYYMNTEDCRYDSCAEVRWIAFSPDGTRVAWYSSAPTEADGVADVYTNIWVANVDGTDLTRVTNFNSDTIDGDPEILGVDWSADGTRIAFLSSQDPGPDRVGGSSAPTVSNLWTVDVASQALFCVTNFTEEYHLDVATWSPTGNDLVFSSHQDPVDSTMFGQRNIFTVKADGTGLRALTAATSNAWSAGPYWFSDGKTVLFESTLVPEDPTTSASRVGILGVTLDEGATPKVIDRDSNYWDYSPVDNND